MKRLFLLGPILFTVVVIVLTILQYDFLLGLGWDPIKAPTLDWPSGLSLGPYGLWMIATFIITGFALFFFALRLRADLKPAPASRIGSIALACSGFCMAGLAFTTDPTLRPGPHTWHGILHDTAFVLVGLSLLISMFFLGKAFQNDPRWRGYGIYTWITAAFAIPSFFLKGAAFYFFLLAVLVWNEVIAIRLVKIES
jgi:hypothetical protein